MTPTHDIDQLVGYLRRRDERRNAQRARAVFIVLTLVLAAIVALAIAAG